MQLDKEFNPNFSLAIPILDPVFKDLFGSLKENCIALLNGLLLLPEGKKIKDLQYLNPEILGNEIKDKISRLDILARLDNGSLVNIEIQYNYQFHFEKRLLFYFSRIISSQLEQGANYRDLRPVYMVSIVNFVLYPNDNKYYRRLSVRDEDCSSITYMEVFTTHVFELPKYKKISNNAKNEREMWLSFLCNPESKVVKEFSMKHEILEKAYKRLEELSMNPSRREEYIQKLKEYSDLRTNIEGALDKGHAEGKAEGILEGKAESRKLTVLRMKAQGLPVSLISACTELSEEEINSLE